MQSYVIILIIFIKEERMSILNDIKNCVNCIYFNEGPEDSYGKRDYFCDKEQSFIEDIYVDITKSSPLYNNEKPKRCSFERKPDGYLLP